MDTIKNILTFISIAFSKAKDFLNQFFLKILGFSESLLIKIFGQSRYDKATKNLKNTYNGVNDSVNSYLTKHVDTEGQYYKPIKKVWKWFGWVIFSGLGYLFLLFTNFLWLTGKMPTVEELQNPKMNQASEIYTFDEQLIDKFWIENRVIVDSTAMSPWLFKALIATEDKRFYEHSGMDLRSMVGVFVGILKGGDRGGGSTISQQLAKNLYSTRGKEMRGLLYYVPLVKTLIYKTKEWLTAFSLEKNFTKGEIMTLYFNEVPFGNNSHGIEIAAKTYFNKKASALTLEESAVLVGLQKGTTMYNPIRNIERSTKRRNTVLSLMRDAGFLTEERYQKAIKKPIVLNVNLADVNKQSSYIEQAVRQFIKNWSRENKEDLNLSTGGYKIYTTIDNRMQGFAETAVYEQMKRLQKTFDSQWKGQNPWRDEKGKELINFLDIQVKQLPAYKYLDLKFKGNQDSINIALSKKRSIDVFTYDGKKKMEMSTLDSLAYYKRYLQTGMMSMDHKTGFIKAWVGGVDYEFFKYDHVMQGRRQPGSTFKPFVYLAAIDGPKNMSPCDKRKDEPYEAKWKENGEDKVWRPENANGKFSLGNLTLRRAIARSVNAIAAKLGEEVGISTVIEYAQKCGITSPLAKVGSLALGTSDVSLIELIKAYGVFANEGILTEPMLIARIEDKSGKVLYEFTPKTKQAIDKESAFLMQYMLRGGIEESGGTGRGMFTYNLFQNNGQVAGKTGTTSNYSDAWYVGFTKDIVTGVWVGGDNRSIHFKGSLGEGAQSAMPIFGKYMEKVYGTPALGYRMGPFPKPSINIKKNYDGCSSSEGGVAEEDYYVDTLEVSSSDIDSNKRNLPTMEQIKPVQLKVDTLKK